MPAHMLLPTEQKPEITVLSFGGGQDSTSILYLLIHDPDFRAKYAPGKLIAIFSDTMDEHPQTYSHIEKTKIVCESHSIPFFHIHPDQGHHGWEGLRQFYRRTNTVGSKCFMKTCTCNLKLVPIYKSEREYPPRSGGVVIESGLTM